MGAAPLTPHIQKRLDGFREMGGISAALICLGKEDCLEKSKQGRVEALSGALEAFVGEAPPTCQKVLLQEQTQLRGPRKICDLDIPLMGLD